MRKVVVLMLAMVMTLSFTACGTKEIVNNEIESEGTNTDNNAAEDNGKLIVGTNAAEDNGKLIVGTEPGFPPYEYVEGDKTVGIDMDIAQAIADAMGKELVIKNMDFDGALLAVQNGKVDLVIAGVSIKEEREKVMDFSDKYVDSKEVVVVNKETPMVDSIENLDGKIIGVQQGNIADYYVEEQVKAKDIKRYKKFSQAVEDLKNNKIDCIVMDEYPAKELVEQNNTLTILDGILFEDNYAIAVKKGNKQLLEQVNEVIRDLIENGKIEEFTSNHVSK